VLRFGVSLVTDVPDDLKFHGIEPPHQAGGFAITLDQAEPQGGGRITGRVERRHQRRDSRPVHIEVRCDASWMDIAPQFVGRKRILSWSAAGDMRNRAIPVWLEAEVFRDGVDAGPLEDANWRSFSFDLPDGLPRALEGTFVAFRWRIEARRARRLGTEMASLPLLLVETQTLPVVRVETSPIGTWRLLEWRSEHDVGWAGGRCSVSFEARRATDMPLPGETREAEISRRGFK
jgi:hypothetical protein